MEYSQSPGLLDGVNPGERIRGAVGGDNADAAQSGPGLLGGGQPGERVRNALGGGGGMADLGQDGGPLSVPNNPGPAAAGRTPLVGTVRRSNGMPVARDQLSGLMG